MIFTSLSVFAKIWILSLPWVIVSFSFIKTRRHSKWSFWIRHHKVLWGLLIVVILNWIGRFLLLIKLDICASFIHRVVEFIVLLEWLLAISTTSRTYSSFLLLILAALLIVSTWHLLDPLRTAHNCVVLWYYDFGVPFSLYISPLLPLLTLGFLVVLRPTEMFKGCRYHAWI